MKKLRFFLMTVITLTLAAGYSNIQVKNNTVLAADTKKEITIKADSDFTLKIPANWKKNYVINKSKDKKHGSYVSFSSKKCYKETGDGWLFSIMRYKDDSYTDMPQYELVGKWNGYNYVAVFPTDVQTFGASKAAKKQYKKLVSGVYKSAFSIQPVKKRKKGKNVYRASDYLDFSLKLPAEWKNKYIAVKIGKKKKNSAIVFYEKKCYKENVGGFLFAIARYDDESYRDLPAYELVGKWKGISYVAEFPTDVQFEGATKKAAKQYLKMSKSVEKVARTILR